MRRAVWTASTVCQFLIVLILIYPNSQSFLWTIITAESLFMALNLLMNIANSPICINVVDKYLFYLIISFLACLGDYITWSYVTIWWQLASLLLTCPSIQSNFFNIAEIRDIVANVHQKQNICVRSAFCYVLAGIINALAIANLHADPQISHTELMKQIDFNRIEHLWKFVQLFTLNTLIKMIGQQDTYKARLLKFFYRRGHIIDIPEPRSSILMNQESPQQILRMVIYHRRWDYLYNPRVLNSLIELYRNNQDDCLIELIYHLFNDLYLKSVKFGSIWALMKAVDYPTLYGPLVVAVELSTSTVSDVNIIERAGLIRANLVAIIVSIFLYYGGYTDYVCSALIAQFASLLARPLQLLADSIYHRRMQLNWLCHQNSYNRVIILTQCGLMALSLLGIVSLPILLATTYYWYQWHYQSFFIWRWLAGAGQFSQYHWKHMSGLSTLLYLGLNLADYRYIPVPEVELNLYHSYYRP